MEYKTYNKISETRSIIYRILRDLVLSLVVLAICVVAVIVLLGMILLGIALLLMANPDGVYPSDILFIAGGVLIIVGSSLIFAVMS